MLSLRSYWLLPHLVSLRIDTGGSIYEILNYRGTSKKYYFYKMFVECKFKMVFGVCLFVCGISLTSGQLVSELFPDCTRSCFSQVVSRRRGGDRIYEMKCLFVAVGPNARFIVLPHWVNMS